MSWVYCREWVPDPETGEPVDTTRVVEATGAVRIQIPTSGGLQSWEMSPDAFYAAEVSSEVPAPEAGVTAQSKKTAAKSSKENES